MPPIPKAKRRRVPSGRTGGVYAPVDIADTGQGLAAKGLGELGRGMSNLGWALFKTEEAMQKARDVSQVTEGKAKWIDATGSFYEELQQDQDYKAFEQRATKFASESTQDILSITESKEAREELQNYLRLANARLMVGARKLSRRKEMDYFRASTLSAVTKFENIGDAQNAIAALDSAQEAGYFTAEEVEKRKSTIAANVDYYEAFNKLLLIAQPDTISDPAVLRDFSNLTTDDVLAVLDFDHFPNLTPKLKQTLIKDVLTIANNRKKEAREKLKAIQQQTDINFFGQYGTDLTPSQVVKAVDEYRLSREAGDRWLNRMADPRDYPTDPNTEAQILKRMADPTDLISESDILDLIGKPDGLSTATARRFISDLDMFKDPWFKRIDSWLKGQLGWDGAYEKFMHPQGGIAYKIVIDQLFDAIETEKLRGRDIYNRGTELAIAPIMDYWENVLLLEKPEIARLTALLRGEKVEPETKARRPKPIKKSDVLDPEGIFK